jgi:HEAT repeat protein
MELGRLISQLRDGDVDQQSRAAEQLGKIGGRAAIDALTEGLEAEAGMVGEAAALALAHIGDELAIERLFDSAADGQPAKRRSAAAAGLGEIARTHESLRSAAIEALERTLDLNERWAGHTAVDALTSLGDDRAVDALLAAVRREHSAESQRTAARYLARSPLVTGARAPDALTALSAALTQGDAGWDAVTTLAHVPGGVDVLLGELKQPERMRRYGAVRGLEETGDLRVLPALIEALDDDDASVASAAASSLGHRGDARAIPALRRALGGEASLRAAEALTKFGTEGIRALLAASADLDHSDHGLVTYALHTLGEQAAEPLADLIASGTGDAVRAARAAGELALAGTRDALVAAAGSEVPELRVAALDGLARVSPPRDAVAIFSNLSDEEPEIRAAAVRALAAAPLEDSTADRLAGLLTDGDAVVQAAVADALAVAGMASGHEAPLARLLGDGDPEVRAAAARALRSGRAERSIEPLLVALADPVQDVRAAASGALSALGGAALEPLAARLDDPRRQVREAAALALGDMGHPADEVLAQALESDDTRRRASVTAALAHAAARDSAALVTLLERLDDGSAEVRREALLGVARLEPSQLPPELARTALGPVFGSLDDDDPSLGELAAEALLQLGAGREHRGAEPGLGPEVAEALIAILDSGSARQRRAAAGAIAGALRGLDPAEQPFPGWFWVAREYAVIDPAPWVSALTSALARSVAEDDPLVRVLARSALDAARAALAAKRSGDALIDDHVMGVSAPESNLHSPLPEEQRAGEVATAAPPERAPRYADVTVFKDGAPLPDHQALQEGKLYELEVAVRRVRTGLHMEGSPEPIAEPAAAETVDVLVVVDADGVDVEPSLGWLKLPPEGDSVEHPRFPLTARRPSDSEARRAEISVRLYHGFNLLESLRIRAEVVSRLRPGVSSHLGLEHPVTLEQDRIARGYTGLQETAPRAMHIDVEQADGTYTVRFTMPSSNGHELAFAGVKRLSTDYLESRLVRLRTELDKLALSAQYATSAEGSKSAFHDALMTLAKLGRELWTDLFRSDPHSSLWRIGEWIEAHPPPPESLIQISLDASAGDLIFPWSFLYDRPLPQRGYETPDPDGFWGLRYVVEQQAPGPQPGGPDVLRRADGPLSLAYMLWSQFPNAAAHSQAIAALGEREPVRAVVSSPPVEKPSACIELIQDGDPEHVLYFFAHGSTRRPATALGLDGRDLVLAIYRSLPADKRNDHEVRKAYEQLAEEGSWLKLTFGTLQLARLKELAPGAIAPLVVLNTCDSAQLIPSFGDDSFVSFFLGWGARTVIGTECRMTVHFAHPFAEALLDAVLDGSSFGVALLHARRRFVECRNPLGLAYTLYGSASAGFGPARQP